MISIIVPVYNVKPYLEKCVQSLLNQTYTNIEIILVDDGSTDGSGEVCDLYAQKDKRIKVIHTTNQGVAEARNRGLEIASGNYIGFVDSDDYVDKDMYMTLYNLLESNSADISEVDFLLTDEVEFFNKKRTGFKKILDKQTAIIEFLTGNIVENNLVNKLFSKKVLSNIKFLKKSVGEDMYFVYQALKNSNKIVVDTSYTGYTYVIRKNSAMSGQGSLKNTDNVLLAEKILQNIEEDLKEYALAKVIREKMKSIQKLANAPEVRLKKIREQYLKDVIAYSWIKALRFLSIKHLITFIIMRTSPDLYNYLYKKFQKQ